MNALIALLALAIVIAGAPAAALAQTGWVVLPTFTLAEEFDDNVFVSTTDPKSDFITRMTPALQLGYRSEPFTLLTSGSIDAEIYANNPELSDAANRKRAALEMKYLPFRLLTVSLNVTYFETNTPSELVPTTGLQLARTRATQLAIIPAATYQITSVDTATASYAFFHDTLEGGPRQRYPPGEGSDMRASSRRSTPGFINYRLHVFENQGGPTTITNTPTLGWKRQLTPNTVLTLEGGPRFVSGGPSFIDDTVEPEAHASLEHSFKLAKVALEYHRTEAIVVGRPGKVELESVSGSFEIEPVRLLKLRFQPGYYRTFGGEDPDGHRVRLSPRCAVSHQVVAHGPAGLPLRLPEAGRYHPAPQHRHAQPRLRVPGPPHAVAPLGAAASWSRGREGLNRTHLRGPPVPRAQGPSPSHWARALLT